MSGSDRSSSLLDDSGSRAPSDDYIAYASGADGAGSAGRSLRRRRYVIAGVVGVVVVLLLVSIIGYAMYAKDEVSPDTPGIPAVATRYRLPANVVPDLYDLSLRIDLDSFMFGGRVTAHVRISNSSMPAFVLHSMLLNVTNVTVHVDDSQVAPASYTYYLYGQDEGSGTQYLVIQGVGQYEFPVTDNLNVTVHFVRELPTSTSNGLFATSYVNGQGSTVWIAATQFEPTHARRAFPCFDELQMKARFKVALEVKQGLVALSNAPQLAEAPVDGGFKRVEFDWTVRQSPYLMAFAVSDFVSINAVVDNPPSYPFRVWGQPGRIQAEGHQLANRALQVQQWYATYFDQKFPLAKQDQIWVPGRSGAMENYGLVTYADYGIYVNNATTSALWQSGVSVNAHELAHMLWGDLFTPGWWSDTWLKEGSARFWSYVGMQAIMGDQGDWHSDALAVGSYMETALSADATPATVPLVDTGVQSPAQIQSHFGGPTYNKGGSFLRMIRAMLGEAGFQTACRQFLDRYKFSSAFSTDLFGYFAGQWTDGAGGVSSSDFQAALTTWSTQRGFPLIRAAVTSTTASSRVWQLSQSMYALSDGNTWPVWVQYSYRTAAGVEMEGNSTWLLSSNGYSAQLETPLDAQYVKLNPNRTSFYRVLYSPPSVYDDLRAAAVRSDSTLTMQDRIGLITDGYWTQVDGHLQSWPTVLNSTLPILARETAYPVWAAGVSVLADMWGRLRFAVRNETDAEGLAVLRTYLYRLAYRAADAVQWDLDTRDHADSHLKGMMQVQFGPLACRLGLPQCLGTARKYYQYWRGNSSAAAYLPTANLRALSIGYGARDRAQATQLFTDQYLNASNSPTQQLATLYLEGAMVAAAPADVLTLLGYFASINVTAPLRFTDTVPSVMGRLSQLNDQAAPTLVAALTSQPALFDRLVLPFDASPASRAPFNTAIDVLVGSIQRQDELDKMQSAVLTSARLSGLSEAGRAKVSAAVTQAQANINWVQANWPAMMAAMQAALSNTALWM